MTGYDVSDEELTNAARFLEMTQREMPEQFMTTREDMVRMLAWYASIRTKGAAPGKLVYVNDEKGDGTVSK